MKTLSKPSKPGISRFLKGFIAIVGLVAAAPINAAPLGSTYVFLAGEKFGSGVEIHVTSATRKVTKAKRYTYNLSGTLKVPKGSPLAKLVPNGIPIDSFVEALNPGGAKFLTGTVDNPTRSLPLTLVNKTFKGTKTINGIGTVKISLTVVGKILADGTCVMNVTNVQIKSTPAHNFGTIQFLAGSKLKISAAPEVEFHATNNVVAENAGQVSVRIWRTTNAKGKASVHYNTFDGTANNSDYTPTTGTVTFNDGELFKNVTIPIIDNALNDSNRFFTIQLSNPGNGAVLGGTVPGSHLSTKVTISDDD